RPKLVHHFTIKCVLYGGIAARCSRARAIVSSITGRGHVFTTNSWRNRFLRSVVLLVFRLVLGRSQIIFENPDDLNDFLRFALVDKIRSHLIRGAGVDTTYFCPTANEREAGPFTVLMVGRLLREKGVREFVDAAAIVRNRLPEA